MASTGGSAFTRTQPANGPPIQDVVRVAVLPPRLPPDMCAPAGVGSGECGYDDELNYIHNRRITSTSQSASTSRQHPSPEIFRQPTRTNSWRKSLGFTNTTNRPQKKTDAPPFRFRYVSYDTWRAHYAKDARGRYRGTDTPAEDCLLLPEDVERWRLGEPETMGDLWTRGREALPGYSQAAADMIPVYEADETSTPQEIATETVVARANANQFVAEGRTTDEIITEYNSRFEGRKEAKWKGVMKTAVGYNYFGPGKGVTREEVAREREDTAKAGR